MLITILNKVRPGTTHSVAFRIVHDQRDKFNSLDMLHLRDNLKHKIRESTRDSFWYILRRVAMAK